MTKKNLTERPPKSFPFTAELQGVPRNYRRIDTTVQVLLKKPWEPDVYVVRLRNGELSLASGSMLIRE